MFVKARLSITAVLLSCTLWSGAQKTDFDTAYQPLHSETYVQDKNFYLLTLFQQLPAVRKAFQQNETLQTIHRRQQKRLQTIPSTREAAASLVSLFLWSEDDITAAGNALQHLAHTQPALQQLVTQHLRPSGFYTLYAAQNDSSLLQQAWADACHGLNHIIQVYALGQKPLYPAIDSASYAVQSKTHSRLLYIASLETTQHIATDDFYEPTLHFALTLLEINNRDEAARFEPMETGENKAAIDYARTINWKNYPYTVLLVPGAGNDLPNVPLAAWGKLRLKIAVERYRQGLAPFIAVSGGYVHPFQTPYCEAYEMKRYLITHYGIPEKAILIDPHARHTTTNIRNVNRLLYRYHFPTDRPALIVTDQDQSAYIEDAKFETRCQKEMQCVPYKALTRVSIYDLAYLSDISCLFYNNADPLDP